SPGTGGRDVRGSRGYIAPLSAAVYRAGSGLAPLPPERCGAMTSHGGAMAEWSSSGLQIRLHRFDSGSRLQTPAMRADRPAGRPACGAWYCGLGKARVALLE